MIDHPEVGVVAGALAAAWLGGWRRRGGRLPRARAALFAAGLAALVLAHAGPLHGAVHAGSFSAHMVQHLLLTLAAAPALVAGLPPAVLDALLARRLGPLGLAGAVRAVTRPVPAMAAWTVVLVAWHLPDLYRLAAGSRGWHLVQHASFLVGAGLAWWPVLGPSRLAPPVHYGARLLYLFVFGVPMTVVAAMVTGAEAVLYPTAAPAPLADQRLGGVLMWVPAGVVPLVAFTVVFFRWVAAESE